ncbi:tyrosine-type recombinase/integrase [Actinomadura scrupuli]|uniref:tyrosine-type recombinase/integrase n=1 Tax=Actinomadura scrupuli TaxID=559629 RepID=UPI003D971CFD
MTMDGTSRPPTPARPEEPALPSEAPQDPAALRALVVSAVLRLPALPAPDPGDRYGLAKLTASWLLAKNSHHTRRAYFGDLASWLAYCARTGLDPLKARRADADDWKDQLTVTGPGPHGQVRAASAATLARRLAAVSSWYAYLQSNEVTERNPVGAVTRPRTGRSVALPALDEAATAALLDHAEGRAARLGSEAAWRDAALLALLFHTGVRVSVAYRAQVHDLDHEAGYPILRFTKKGDEPDFVRLEPEVLAPLNHYLTLRAAREHVAVTAVTGRLLLTTPHPYDQSKPGGKPLTQRDVSNTLRALARQAGLPSADTITPHTGRRTVATVLLGDDVPLHKVQDLLGHADPRTTRDGYDAHRHKLRTSPVGRLAQLYGRHRRTTPG